MNLNKSQWKEFRFGDLISDIYKAKAINKDDLTVATDISRTLLYSVLLSFHRNTDISVAVESASLQYP